MVFKMSRFAFLLLPLAVSCGGSKENASASASPSPKNTVRSDGNPVASDGLAKGACSASDEEQIQKALAEIAAVEPVRTAAQKQPTIENIRNWLHLAQLKAIHLEDVLRSNPLQCTSSQLPKNSEDTLAGAHLKRAGESLKHDVAYLKDSYAGKL